MKKFLLLVVLFALLLEAKSQELYIYSEPASNMPAKTLGLKFTGLFSDAGGYKQRYKPEIMFGVNKSWMVHVSSSLSNYYSSNTRFESAKVYAKYRFYSDDDVHKHFRMAAFADVAFTRSPFLYDEASLEGDNSGAQVGLIATKLVNKFAVSGTVAYTGLFNDSKVLIPDNPHSLNAVNYSLSAGYLILPKEYVNYNQTNLNAYIEVLGTKSLDKSRYALDLAPALQLIFNSNTKINFGYRFQVAGNMLRVTPRTWLVGFEHTIFNAWK